MERVEVLDKVGGLLLLPQLEMVTTQQVADFYGVPYYTITTLEVRNAEELKEDGCRVYKHNEVVERLSFHTEKIKKHRGKSILYLENKAELQVATRGMKLFPKRAVLRVGMLLRDSEVATTR